MEVSVSGTISFETQIHELKQNVGIMLRERTSDYGKREKDLPAEIWVEALSMFDYVINLSPDNFRKIRFHTGLITGDNPLSHWHQFPPVDPGSFARRIDYEFFTEDVSQQYWLSEPPTPQIPRPIGVEYRGKIINADISRYQHCVSALVTSGISAHLSCRSSRNLMVEIGGGYGGLAHQVGLVLGNNTTYILMDLPEMLLFSGGFLLCNNPGKRVYIYHPATFTEEFLAKQIFEFDFVLLPNFVLPQLYKLEAIHLLLNMMSFQEMDRVQIEEYLDFGRAKLDGFVFCNNLDRHPYNVALSSSSVASLLDERFDLFPSTRFYEKTGFGAGSPWTYKTFIGTPKGKSVPVPENSTLRVSDGITRYRLTRRQGKVQIQSSTDWLKFLVTKARGFLRR